MPLALAEASSSKDAKAKYRELFVDQESAQYTDDISSIDLSDGSPKENGTKHDQASSCANRTPMSALMTRDMSSNTHKTGDCSDQRENGPTDSENLSIKLLRDEMYEIRERLDSKLVLAVNKILSILQDMDSRRQAERQLSVWESRGEASLQGPTVSCIRENLRPGTFWTTISQGTQTERTEVGNDKVARKVRKGHANIDHEVPSQDTQTVSAADTAVATQDPQTNTAEPPINAPRMTQQSPAPRISGSDFLLQWGRQMASSARPPKMRALPDTASPGLVVVIEEPGAGGPKPQSDAVPMNIEHGEIHSSRVTESFD